MPRTLSEIERWLDRHDTTHDRFVSKDLYDEQIRSLREDISEIKENQKWTTRLVITQLVGIVAAVLIYLVTNAQS